MKITILLLCMLPAFAFAQPKGANAITVHGVSFSQVDDTLNARGFQIDKLDTAGLTTKSKQYYSEEGDSKSNHANIVITVQVKGSDAIFTALYTYEEQTKVFGAHSQVGKPTVVENIYSKGSYMRRAFDYMDGIAKSFGGAVSYSRR
jgi:hypothetical protein